MSAGAAVAAPQQDSIEELLDQLYWRDGLMQNNRIKPGVKATIYSTRQVLEEQKRKHPRAGRVRVPVWLVAQRSGQSTRTVVDHWVFADRELGIWHHTTEEPTTNDLNGKPYTPHFIEVLDDFNYPHTWDPGLDEQGKKKSVRRYPPCPNCGSKKLVITRTICCAECGTLVEEPERREVEAWDEIEGEEAGATCGNNIRMFITSEGGETTPADTSRAALHLLHIAGDQDKHIEMQPTGGAKYLYRDNALTYDQVVAHLEGRATYGAYVQRQDGLTYALAYDGDDAARFDVLLAAADKLGAAGLRSLAVQSPSLHHRGGGHLWLLWERAVNTAAALALVEQIAPELKDWPERWPCAGSQAIRLPGGRYRRPNVDELVRVALVDGDGLGQWQRGPDVATLILAAVNPAELVPTSGHYFRIEQAEAGTFKNENFSHLDADFNDRQMPNAKAPEIPNGLESGTAPSDPPLTVYPNPAPARSVGTRYFAYTSKQVADYFNARHRCTDLLPLEPNGYGLAIWRGERTASVKVHPDHWTDMGAGGRHDGKRDGGDALELYCRIEGFTKARALSIQGAAMVRDAKAELERAAAAGREPASWVRALMTGAGHRYFSTLSRASTMDAPPPGGSIVSAVPPPLAPKQCQTVSTGSAAPASAGQAT